MALTHVNIALALNWVQTKAVTGTNSGEHTGPVNLSQAPTVSGAAANRVYFVQGTLAAGAAATIDLRSLTEPVFAEALTPSRAYILVVYGTTTTWRYDQGAANPLAWFLGGTTPQVNGNAGAWFAYADATAAVIDATNRNVRITNTAGSGTLTYTFAVILGV